MSSCEAYGCPLPGAHSESTTGGGKWYCFLHFRADYAEFQNITKAIRAAGWLSDGIVQLRRTYGAPRWPSEFRAMQATLVQRGRSDLQWRDAEPVWQWIRRLEGALQEICAGKASPPVIPITQRNDGWKKVGFNAPAWSGDEEETGT